MSRAERLLPAPRGEDSFCCWRAIDTLGAECTCWEPVYGQAQQPATNAPVTVQPSMCAHCAYRPGSPERSDDHEADDLEMWGAGAGVFFCHQGARRPTAWRHVPEVPFLDDVPGLELKAEQIPDADRDYRPVIVGRIPRAANGDPLPLCAGWVARIGRAPATVLAGMPQPVVDALIVHWARRRQS